MDNKLSPYAINELRANLPAPERKIFKKSLLGGYNSKQVQEHLRFMNDRLSHADASYKNQLDEYNAMVTMLTQERDKLREQLTAVQADKDALERKAALLGAENKELSLENKNLEKAAARANEYQAESGMLRAQIEELTGQLQERARAEEAPRDEAAFGAGLESISYEDILAQNALLKKQYEEVLKEKDALSTERNLALDKNRTVSENLDEMYARNRELWNENARMKLRIRKLIAGYETSVHEISFRHMKNIDEIRDSINTIMDLLDSEGAEISKLVGSAYDGLEGEDRPTGQ